MKEDLGEVRLSDAANPLSLAHHEVVRIRNAVTPHPPSRTRPRHQRLVEGASLSLPAHVNGRVIS